MSYYIFKSIIFFVFINILINEYLNFINNNKNTVVIQILIKKLMFFANIVKLKIFNLNSIIYKNNCNNFLKIAS